MERPNETQNIILTLPITTTRTAFFRIGEMIIQHSYHVVTSPRKQTPNIHRIWNQMSGSSSMIRTTTVHLARLVDEWEHSSRMGRVRNRKVFVFLICRCNRTIHNPWTTTECSINRRPPIIMDPYCFVQKKGAPFGTIIITGAIVAPLMRKPSKEVFLAKCTTIIALDETAKPPVRGLVVVLISSRVGH